MNRIQRIALLYVAAVVLIGYGYAIATFKVFPASYIDGVVEDFREFAAGDATETSSTLDKLKNDLGVSFKRFEYSYPEIAAAGAVEQSHPNLVDRKDPPMVYVAESQRSGYRGIVGFFNLEGARWGALLLDPEGRIVHTWDLSTEHLPGNLRPDHQKNLYPAHIYPDGSVIFSMAEQGGGIVKVDACSQVVWNAPGHYHHSISPDEEGNFWSFEGSQIHFDQDMVKMSAQTGEIVERIRMKKVRKLNPKLYIWDLQTNAFAPMLLQLGRKPDSLYSMGNITHGNDIEPLPSHLADAFPQFEVGDLVVSYAMTNLIFVINPSTLEVKWWRIGATDSQHDPDWEPDGTIGVYSNNTRLRRFADIVSLDTATMQHSVSLDGSLVQMRSPINGSHQLTSFDTRMVIASQQGRAFEVDADNQVVFSFVNNIDSEARSAYHLSRAWRYPEGYFVDNFWEDDCASVQ